jgi:hypothetical protein
MPARKESSRRRPSSSGSSGKPLSRRMEVMRALQDGDPDSLGVLQELAKSARTPVRLTALGGLAELGAEA